MFEWKSGYFAQPNRHAIRKIFRYPFSKVISGVFSVVDWCQNRISLALSRFMLWIFFIFILSIHYPSLPLLWPFLSWTFLLLTSTFTFHLVSGPFIYNLLELWSDKPVLDMIDFLQHTHLARSWHAKTWTSAPAATTAPSFLLSRRASKSSRGNRSLTHFKYQWKVKA